MSDQVDPQEIISIFSVEMQALAYGVSVETMVYGIYTVMFGMSTWFLLHRKLRSRADIFMFSINTIMYLCATGHWAMMILYIPNAAKYSLEVLQLSIPLGDTLNNTPTDHLMNRINSATQYLSFANYVLNDIVVIWRAWLVSGLRARRWIIISGCFAIFIETVLFIVSMQLPDTIFVSTVNHNRIALTNFLTPMAYYITLLTNIWATGIIARKAWILRRQLKRASMPFGRSSPVGKVFILLVESGALYCIFWAIYLGMFSADLVDERPFFYPSGLSIIFFDILGLCMVYYAGMYLSIIIVMVCFQRTFGENIDAYSSPSGMPTPRGLTVENTENAASPRIRSRIEFDHPPVVHQIATRTFSSPDIESRPWSQRTSIVSSRHGVSFDDSRSPHSQLESVAERESCRDSSSEGHSVEVAERKDDDFAM